MRNNNINEAESHKVSGLTERKMEKEDMEDKRQPIAEEIIKTIREYAKSYAEQGECAFDEYYWDIKNTLDEGQEPHFRPYGLIDSFSENLSLYMWEEWEKEFGLSYDEIIELIGGENTIDRIISEEGQEVWDKVLEKIKEEFIQEHTQEGTIQDLKALAKFIAESDDWEEVLEGAVNTYVYVKDDNINLLRAHPCFDFRDDKMLELSSQGPGWADHVYIADESDEEELYDAIAKLAYDYVEYALEHYTDEAILEEVINETGYYEDDERCEMILYDVNWEIYNFEDMEAYEDEIAEILGVKEVTANYNYANRELCIEWYKNN